MSSRYTGVNPLVKYLKRSGMRPAHFAALIGASPSAVSMWLSGDRVPDRDSAVLIEGATEGEIPVKAWGRAKKRSPRVRMQDPSAYVNREHRRRALKRMREGR
jgi:hypothetical protein